MTKYCKCGCGTVIPDSNTWSKGHNRRGKPPALKGKSWSDDQKKNHSRVMKGKMSDERKKELSDILKQHPLHTGKLHSEAAKKKMSDAKKGKKTGPRSEDARQRVSAGLQGIPYDKWESFACEKKYCPKFNEACKESNRAKYGRRCFICNKTEKANGQKLSVHHVDMDKAQGCESNWKLVPLCKHCHSSAHNDEIIARLGYLIKVI